MSVLLFIASLLGPSARAATCDDPLALEGAAFRGGLTDAEEQCLAAELAGLDPDTRAQVSFMLIVHAHMTGDNDGYAARMREHLTRFHTEDTEVAYLYATWLRDQEEFGEELIRWAKVALEGRFQWTDNRRFYTPVVQSLYDMINEASLVTAALAQRRYEAAPTEENRRHYATAQQRARYYLTVSAPCLSRGECRPRYSVEVVGSASCVDMYDLADRAAYGGVTDDELSCLRSRYRRPTANKRKILEVMAANARHDDTGKQWRVLLEFQYRVGEAVDPQSAASYAQFLVVQGGAVSAQEAASWAQIALQSDDLRGGVPMRRALHDLRVAAAEELLALSTAEGLAEDSPSSSAARLLAEAQADRAAWCAQSERNCR